MLNFRQSLPQLDLLIAFEAASRHGSFTRAAEELNITQSAVSQQIRTLEERLGLALFERSHRVVRLSPAGRTFHNSVSVALGHLLNATNALRESAGTARLHIAADESFAALWLSSRLQKFQTLNPDVRLQLTASDRPEDCFAENIELAIVHGDGRWPGYECERLIDEEVFPVCSPEYLNKSLQLDGIEDLRRHQLIDLEYERWSWMNWSIWLTEKGKVLSGDQRVFQCNSYPIVLQASRQGLGLALGWSGFLDEDLANGTLVRPLKESLKTRYAYHLVQKHNAPASPQAQLFKEWILRERRAQIDTASLPK